MLIVFNGIQPKPNSYQCLNGDFLEVNLEVKLEAKNAIFFDFSMNMKRITKVRKTPELKDFTDFFAVL